MLQCDTLKDVLGCQERDGAGPDMLEVVMVAELCRSGTLCDHIDVQASLSAAAAATCDGCCHGGGLDPPPPLAASAQAPQHAAGAAGNAACRCPECQERAPAAQPPQMEPPMRWSRALPSLTFASADGGRQASPLL